jgi:uncharacterized membrane protein
MAVSIDDGIDILAKSLEVVGVLVLVGGILWSVVQYARTRHDLKGRGVYQHFRQSIGRSILLGLELLVAADIIHTVATPLSFESLGMLGLLIVIRTFLSIEIEMELEGRWPWQNRPTADTTATDEKPSP